MQQQFRCVDCSDRDDTGRAPHKLRRRTRRQPKPLARAVNLKLFSIFSPREEREPRLLNLTMMIGLTGRRDTNHDAGAATCRQTPFATRRGEASAASLSHAANTAAIRVEQFSVHRWLSVTTSKPVHRRPVNSALCVLSIFLNAQALQYQRGY